MGSKTQENFVFQRSTNFIDWTLIYTNSPSEESFSYSDNMAANYPNVFYRVVEKKVE